VLQLRTTLRAAQPRILALGDGFEGRRRRRTRSRGCIGLVGAICPLFLSVTSRYLCTITSLASRPYAGAGANAQLGSYPG
jgi:hypothetical protein